MKQIQIILGTILILMSTMGVANAQETPIAQINGEDVALSTDTVIASFTYGNNLKGKLLDSGINFVLIENRTGGANDSVTVFSSDDVFTICSWDGVDLSDISLVFNGVDVYCVE